MPSLIHVLLRSRFAAGGRLLAALLLSLCCTLAQAAMVSTITTVAGNGRQGAGGDGGLAADAQLNGANGLAMDAAGNLYIADSSNHRIRKVDAVNGIIAPFAGSGVQGFGGDGAAAIGARLNSPAALALDAAGNLYIADPGNHRIRKVDAASGAITTVAGSGIRGFGGDGGPAAAARFDAINGIAVSKAGEIYIADSANNRIRKVDMASGTITTFAGNGQGGFAGDGGQAVGAQLYYPTGVALDEAGNLYVADRNNSRIRKVDVATGRISTVAGSSRGFSGDWGPATAAKLALPYDVRLDAAGNLYIADTYNQRIRKVLVGSGTIITIAGSGLAGFGGDKGPSTKAVLNYPGFMLLDKGGNAYLSDTGNHRIRSIGSSSLPTEGGEIIPEIEGGGALCGVEVLRREEAVPDAPRGWRMPYGAVHFALSTCTGPVRLKLTFPGISEGGKYMKLRNGLWQEFRGAEISGSSVTLALEDGGDMDDDGLVNGRIVDPGALLVPFAEVQGIEFASQAPQRFVEGGSFAIDPPATASSGLPVGYASSTPGVCTVSGGTVTMVSAGTCTVVASQGGNIHWEPAADVAVDITLTPPAPAAQSITFPAQAGRDFVAGGSFAIDPVATASSGLQVSYASSTPAVCTVASSVVTMVSAGTCTLVASQGGNAEWEPAADVEVSLVLADNAGPVDPKPPVPPVGQATPVPVLGPFGLGLMSLLSGGMGLVRLRRRQRA